MVKKIVLCVLGLILINCTEVVWSCAEQRKLVIAGPGGMFKEVFCEYAIKPFEEKNHNVKVSYVVSEPAGLGSLQSGASPIDLFIGSEDAAAERVDAGLFEQLDLTQIPNAHNLYEYGKIRDDYGVAIGAIATGIAYNTKVFKEKGFARPTSWTDLYRPEFEGHVVIQDISNVYGLHSVIATANLEGDTRDVDKAFEKFESLQDKILTLNKSSVQLADLFTHDKAWISPWGSNRVWELANKNIPVGFVYPDEGVPLLRITVSKLKGSGNSDAAYRFIDELLSKSFQEALVSNFGWGPTSSEVELTGKVAEILSYEEHAKKIIEIDWSYVNENWPRWTERWNEVFAEWRLSK